MDLIFVWLLWVSEIPVVSCDPVNYIIQPSLKGASKWYHWREEYEICSYLLEVEEGQGILFSGIVDYVASFGKLLLR